MDTPEFETSPDANLSRRGLLHGAAIGSAVAGGLWATPSILTLDAASACGSSPCTTGTTTFAWSTVYAAQAALAPVNAPGAGHLQALAPATVGGVQVTTTRSDTFSQTSLAGGSWRIRGTSGGGCGGNTEQLWHLTPTPNSWLRIRMGQGTVGTDNNRFVDTTIAFDTPVRDLRFSVLDVDASFATPGSGNYRDRVTISGVSTSAFSYDTLFQGSGLAVTGLGAGNVGVAATEWRGIGPGAVPDCQVADPGTPPIDTGGFFATNGSANLRICVLVPVTSITVRQQRGQNNSGTNLVGGQHIGIGDLSWCTI